MDKYMKQWYIGPWHEEQWSWGGGKQMRWALWLSQLTAQKEFQAMVQREQLRQSQADSVHWGDKTESPRRWPEFTGQSTREEKNPQTERALEICRGSPIGIELSIDQCMHVRTLPEVRQDPPERIGRNKNQCSPRARHHAYSLQGSYLMIHRALDAAHKRSYLSKGT